MIIGIDASRANRAHKTGTEWYSYYLIKWLARLDDKNEYILYVDEPLKGGLLDLTSVNTYDPGSENVIEYDEDGFQKIKSPHNNFKAKVLKWPFYYFWTLGRLSLEMLFKSPDVLFIPSHTLPLIHPKKSIVTIHDVGFETDEKLYDKVHMNPNSDKTGKLLNLIVNIVTFGKYKANPIDYCRWSTNYIINHAKKVITVSEFSKHEIIKNYKVKKNKVVTIHNGYNKQLYKTKVDPDILSEILIKYGIDGPYFFYIGRIEKKKNVPALIEAYQMMREKNKDIKLKLVLAGDASYGYDEVKYIIREYNLVDQVLLPGWVEEEDLPYLYQGSSGFVFPSCYEGFGIPLPQAMASEVPIITSDIPAIKEVVGDSACFFDPNNKESIARALEKIAVDSELTKNLIEKGKERVKDFDWELCAKKTLEHINSL